MNFIETIYALSDPGALRGGRFPEGAEGVTDGAGVAGLGAGLADGVGTGLVD